MNVRRIILGAALALAAASPAMANVNQPGATIGWRSNTFVSPSGNIHCRYFPALGAIACTTANTGLTVAVERTGAADHNYANLIRTGGPVLGYGMHWTVANLRCDSTFAAMTCRSSSGHGFVVNRTTWDVW